MLPCLLYTGLLRLLIGGAVKLQLDLENCLKTNPFHVCSPGALSCAFIVMNELFIITSSNNYRAGSWAFIASDINYVGAFKNSRLLLKRQKNASVLFFFSWDAVWIFKRDHQEMPFSVHLLLDPKLYSKPLSLSSFYRCLIIEVHSCL